MPLEDAEQAAYIEMQPVGMPYTELAASCRQKFGLDRAWTASEIRDYWLNAYPTRSRYCSPICADRELMALIEDYEGRLSHAALLTHIRAILPAKRHPSRSVLYRLLLARRMRRLNPSGSEKCLCIGRSEALSRVVGRDDLDEAAPRSERS